MNIVKIGLVLLGANGRMLVVRKRGGTTFILPGGKPEKNEDDHTCLTREVGEEIQVSLASSPKLLGSYHAPAADQKGDTVEVRAYLALVEGTPEASMEIEELRWIDTKAPDVPLAESISKGVIPDLKAIIQ